MQKTLKDRWMKDVLKTYVPNYILSSLQSDRELPLGRSIQAGLLYLDVSGFTALTEKLDSLGHYELERLTNMMRQYFNAVVGIIYSNKGEIHKYGGDSFLAVFMQPQAEFAETLKCLRTSLKKAIAGLNATFCKNYGCELQVHGAALWGTLCLHIIGSREKGVEWLLDGEAVSQIFSLCGKAQSNQIISRGLSKAGAEKAPQNLESGFENTIHQKTKPCKAGIIFPEQKDKIFSSGFKAELRQVVTVFIVVKPRLKQKTLDTSALQTLYQLLIAKCREYGAYLNKLDYSDKGYIALILFGVFKMEQDDVQKALKLSWELCRANYDSFSLKAGITSSRLFVGNIGSERRREFSVLGDGVNHAARLAGIAKMQEVITAEKLSRFASGEFSCEFCAELELKGKSGLQKVFYLTRRKQDIFSIWQQQFSGIPLIERHKLIDELMQVKHDPVRMALQGALGSGKTLLLYQLSKTLQQKGYKLRVLSFENHLATQPWQLIFSLSRETGIDLPSCLQSTSLSAGEDDTGLELQQRLHELGNWAWEQVKDSDLIILDSIQNLDKSSRQIIDQISSTLIAGGKSVLSSGSEEGTAGLSSFEPFKIPPLSPSEGKQLISRYLIHCSRDVSHELWKSSKGNPQLLVELCCSIKNATRGSTQIITETQLLGLKQQVGYTETLTRLLLSRLNQLSSQWITVLKFMAIIGKAGTYEDLSYLLPRQLKYYSVALADRELSSNLVLTTDSGWSFSSAWIREAIYNTIPRSEKRKLHRKYALGLQKRQDSTEINSLIALAEHFDKAESKQKAYHFNWLSALACLRSFALPEAEHYLQRCLVYVSAKQRNEVLIELAWLKQAQGDVFETEKYLNEVLGALTGRLRDRWVWIRSRLFAIRGDCEKNRLWIESWLTKVEDPQVLRYLKHYLLDCFRELNLEAEFRSLSEQLIAETASLEPIWQGRLNTVLAAWQRQRSNLKEALLLYEQNCEIAEQSGSLFLKRMANHGAANVLVLMGNCEPAKPYYEKALQAAEKLGEKDGYAKLLADFAKLELLQANYSGAAELYGQSLELAEACGNVTLQALCQYNLGAASLWDNRLEDALNFALKARELYLQVNDISGLSFLNDLLGDIYYNMQEFAKAETIYRQNLVLQQQLKDKIGIAHTFGNLGNLALDDKNYQQAKKFYKAQQLICGAFGDLEGEGKAWYSLGILCSELGDKDGAIEAIQTAIETFEKCGSQYLVDFATDALKDLQKPE